MKTSIAIYPGSFDPVTNGHLDLIERGEKMFDSVIVAVLKNAEKEPLFSVPERIEMLRESTKQWPSVEIDIFQGLLVDYARKKGAVVNIIGLAGESFNYDYVAGTMGNAGLMAFTRAVGSKSVDHGVRVVAINPPATRTDRMLTLLRGQAEQKWGDPERWPELTKHMPFGRAAEPDEVADLAVFLASDRASYISGVVMTLDGGQAAKH